MSWDAIIAYVQDRFAFFATIFGAAVARVLLWVMEEPPEEDTDKARRFRLKRTLSGITIGLIVAGVATGPLVAWVPFFDEGNDHLVGGLLVFMGEQLVRRLSRPEDLIDRILDRVIGRRGGE